MISIFKDSHASKPIGDITIDELIKRIKNGFWGKIVLNVREKKNTTGYKKLKESLPGVTVSGQFKERSKYAPLTQKLTKHSGFICLDIDRKDNLKLRAHDLVDKECYAQFLSCSGEGIKIIYRCTPTSDKTEHRRIYDAAVLRLQKLGINIKVDPIVKSIASLQYVSFDPDAYYFPKTKLVLKPLKIKKEKIRPPSDDLKKDLEQLQQYIESLEGKDVTSNYENWLTIAFGLSYSLGEHGRKPFHDISKNYKNYVPEECDEQYTVCLERNVADVGKPVTIASVYQIINDALPKVKLRHLSKQFSKSHAVGEGEEENDNNSDLQGYVRYRLFLFKKLVSKEDKNSLVDLVPHGINLNAFEVLLREKGFKRFGKLYIQIINNIIEQVDEGDILRIVTQHVEQDGDYEFTYKGVDFKFSWEELAHRWRELRGTANIYNQIASSLEHWRPNLLTDTPDTSYIPYQNGVVEVTKASIKLLPYEDIKMQIWKERILPRTFTYTKAKGMYEEFFENVCGRGKTADERRKSESYKRAVWYYGYMLQGTKRQSTARAWLLYDIRAGNNGRTGKTIIGQAVGKIRSMVTIDGKQFDSKNRFAFQTVKPWTNVVFIDDPSKFMSIQPLFNMITGELQADRKNIDPLILNLKFMFASNWVLEAEGTSEAGRQFVTQIDDFYVRWGKEHGNTITPIVDYHGKEFYTDWDVNDWNAFDSFSIRCLQTHLAAEAPKNEIIGNSKLVRFVQLYEQELFYNLANVLSMTAVKGKQGTLLVPQGLLISCVKEQDGKYTAIQAGRIVKEFLGAIGVTDIKITSMIIAGVQRMSYELNKSWEQLEFGEFNKAIAKPKNL